MAVRVRRDLDGTALLVYRRQFLGLDQEHVARIAGRTRQWVSRLENGDLRTCDEVTAARIARFMQTTASDLFEQIPFPSAGSDSQPAESSEVRRAG